MNPRLILHLKERWTARSGLALPDLLISLALAGLLGTLLIPAIQQARESARMIHCRDHLRQFGLAAQQHASTSRGAFPYTATNGSDAKGLQILASVSPHLSLMPYLETSVKADRITADPLLMNDTKSAPSYSDNVRNEIASVRIAVLLCPSDEQRAGATNYRANLGDGPGVYARDENSRNAFRGSGSGAFVHGTAVSVGSFRDGLSNTILFSEKLTGDGNPDSYTPQRDFHFVTGDRVRTADDAVLRCNAPVSHRPGHASFSGWTWLLGGWNSTWYNHVSTPNSRMPDCSEGSFAMAGGGSGSYTARSYHAGGVNVVFADGSGRFTSENIDLEVWRSLSTRAGEEVHEHEPQTN